MNSPSFDRLLSVWQAAENLSLSPRSVRRILPAIGFVRVGRSIRIPQSYLEEYLRHRFVPPEEMHSRRRSPVQGNLASITDGIIERHRRGA
jgi:excisionase family DNA binding protein